jgi:SanA protein
MMSIVPETEGLPQPDGKDTEPAKRPRRRWLRRALLTILGLGAFAAVAAYATYRSVHGYERYVYSDVAAVPDAPVAIVFGAGIINNKHLSDVLYDRVETAVELYKAGKVKKLLMTGDNSVVSHNEPDAMKRKAVEMGVPADAIACDYAGFRTYDSLYRARHIFGVRRAILVTQRYHLPRALFTAEGLGIAASGMAAEKRPYIYQDWFNTREVLAVERAWWDVRIAHAQPKYMGKPEKLF